MNATIREGRTGSLPYQGPDYWQGYKLMLKAMIHSVDNADKGNGSWPCV